MINNITLTEDEKKYLWSKIEYSKKKRATETTNDLYHLLNDDKTSFTNEDFNTIFNSLEYVFKKKLSGLDTPLKNEMFSEIRNKIPEEWMIKS